MSARWRAVLPDNGEREFDLKTEQCGCHSLRTEHVHRIFDEHGTKLGGSHASLTEAVVQAFGEIKQIVEPGGLTVDEALALAPPLRLFSVQYKGSGFSRSPHDTVYEFVVLARDADHAFSIVCAAWGEHGAECVHHRARNGVRDATVCIWMDPALRTATEIDLVEPGIVAAVGRSE